MIKETTEFELIVALDEQIPEFASRYSLDTLRFRLAGRPFLALLSLEGERAVGYKVGYAETPRRFYSWLGGVLPEHRREGRARAMLRYQESWCRGQGYKEITVWSENRYRSMLLFLLTEEYDIFGLSANGAVQFRKVLD